MFYINEHGEYKFDNVLQLMDKDYTLENSSEDQKEEIGTQLESFMPFDMPFKIKRPHTGWAFFKKIIYVFPWSEEGRRHGRKVGRKDFQQAGWSSTLPRRIPMAESGWSVFGSWLFLVVECGLDPVLAFCLSAVSVFPTLPCQVSLLSHKETRHNFCPSSDLLLAPFFLPDLTLNVSFSHVDQFNGRKKETSPH